MLPTTCCIRLIYSLLAGGAVSCGVGYWDAAPNLRGAVGYGAYWVLLGCWCLYFCNFFKYILAWIYLMCACRNTIWGRLCSIILPYSLLKWWTLRLGCLWGGWNCLHQHTSRRSHQRLEINQLDRIYVSRGLGYDSPHNIHVAGVCLVGISFLIYLLGGGRKWTLVFRNRCNHY